MIINKDNLNSAQEATALVKQANRRTFFEALDQKEKSKVLIWDADLLKLFSQFAKFTELKNDHSVLEMHTLQKKPQLDVKQLQMQKVDHVIYISRQELSKIDLIIEHVQLSVKNAAPQVQKPKGPKTMPSSSGSSVKFHILFVPRSSTFGESKLKESDVLYKFDSILDLPVHMFVWDNDVLNLEDDKAFKELLIDGEAARCLYDISSSLYQLKLLFGPFGELFYKGEISKKIFELLTTLEKTTKPNPTSDETRQQRFKIDRVLLLDRSVDLIAPLVTQLTYEGLIDEHFGINYGTSPFPNDKFEGTSSQNNSDPSNVAASTSKTQKPDKYRQIQLNSNDELFCELRNLNFNAVGLALSRKLKQLAELKQQIQSASTVRECKEFVKKIPQLKSAEQLASTHLTIAEILKEKTANSLFLDTIAGEQEILNIIDPDHPVPLVEELTMKGENMEKVLRLICLQSLVCDGLKKKTLDQYRREFVQSFGYQHLNLLCNLQKAGLLKCSTSGHGKLFEQNKKNFRLLVDGVKEHSPDDIAYVYSGFAPLLIRLCQYLQKATNYETNLETLQKLPGASGGQVHPDYEVRPGEKQICLIVFVGGVTCSEIAALRFLSSSNENFSYLILTTTTINGNKMVDSMIK